MPLLPLRRPFPSAAAPFGWGGRTRVLAVLVAGVLLAGCLGDAERTNPLDPLSDNFRDAGAVTGAIVRLSAPAQGVPGASVRLAPEAGGTELVARTGGDGRFSLSNVPSGTYRLTAEATGFAPADTVVTVTAGVLSEQGLRLNALPRIIAQTVRSERINRFFPDPQLFSRITVEASVVDPDGSGDIGRVDLVIPAFSGAPGVELFRDSLTSVPGTAVPTYRRTFLETELPVTIQQLLGRNLFVEARDLSGTVALSGDMHVVRIIEAIPVAAYPLAGDDPVRLPFALRWDPLPLPYSFTWRVEMFYVPEAGQEIPAGVLQDIPSSTTQVLVTSSLPPGNYSWRIAAVDEFGNLGRSREAGFQIAAP